MTVTNIAASLAWTMSMVIVK